MKTIITLLAVAVTMISCNGNESKKPVAKYKFYDKVTMKQISGLEYIAKLKQEKRLLVVNQTNCKEYDFVPMKYRINK